MTRAKPDIPRPFTMWLYPWPAVLSGALWLFIFCTEPREGILQGRFCWPVLPHMPCSHDAFDNRAEGNYFGAFPSASKFAVMR